MARTRNRWGWGFEDAAIGSADARAAAPGVMEMLGFGSTEVERLRAAGATFRNEIVTGVGGKQILLEDPAGNCVELFEPLPR